MEDLPASHVWVPKLWLLVNFQTFQAQFFGGTKRIARVSPFVVPCWSNHSQPLKQTKVERDKLPKPLAFPHVFYCLHQQNKIEEFEP